MRFLVRRLFHTALLLLGISLASFLLLDLAPGDYFDLARLNPQIAPETLAALRARYGLDRPLPVRYGRWLASAVQGDFGLSVVYGAPASTLLRERSGNTLLLTGTATLLVWLIAIPLGFWSATRRGRWPDRLCAASSSALLAVPDLLLATGFVFLAARTGLFPAGGMWTPGVPGLSATAQATDLAAHLVLPVTALVLGALPWLLRHVRASAVEVLDTPFVCAARAHGIPTTRLLLRHVLPAAANPLITLFGLSLAGLLSSSLLVEVVMGWPGLGPLLVEAIASRDLYLILGAVLFSALFLVAGNFVADLLLYACDPRIRVESRR